MVAEESRGELLLGAYKHRPALTEGTLRLGVQQSLPFT